MSEFLKLAYELISKIIYNIVEWIASIVMGFVKVFITGWVDYASIFLTYFIPFSLPMKILSILLALILIAIPVLVGVILVRKFIIHVKLRATKDENTTLYKEIGRLNRQVLSLMDEKNKILALKVNSMGGVGKIPYVGASALTDDTIPSLQNVTGTAPAQEGAAVADMVNVEGVEVPANTPVEKVLAVTTPNKSDKITTSRFPKLTLVDQKYQDFIEPAYNNDITLQEFVENYRLFAASEMHLYYTPEIVRRFVAGMAASKLLILEGISGTGKTSLP